MARYFLTLHKLRKYHRISPGTRCSWVILIFFSLIGALALALLPLSTGLAAGQDGAVDQTFKSGAGPNASVTSVAMQGDGKIIIGGAFTRYSGVIRNRIARLNNDGSVDASFDPNIGPDNNVTNLAVQSDGKIFIVGGFTSYNGISSKRLARLNNNGSLDTSFNPGWGTNDAVYSVAVQSDGKILIGGFFVSYNGINLGRIARLNNDGSVDTSFNVGSGTDGAVYSIAVQSDGKVLIGGYFTNYNGTSRNRIARLNADGSVDTSFNPNVGPDSTVQSIAVQSDGKILIGGDFTSYNGTSRNRIARLHADGSLDTGFNVGSGASFTVNELAVQSDGKVLIVGAFGLYNGVARKFVARLNGDGSLDDTFNVGSGASNIVDTVTMQSDGKVLISSFFTSYNGIGVNGIARLNADGSLDTSFNEGSGADSLIYSMAIQSDDKVLIGGKFLYYNGVASYHIARLNRDGSLDTSFNVGSGPNNAVYSIAVQSNGKILIGGAFTSYNGTARNYIVQLNSDGTIDTSFSPGSGSNNAVYSIAVQSDGKIIIGGEFTSYANISRSHIARLNSDGSLDTTFNVGNGAGGNVYSIAAQRDGKILIGGAFTSYNGIARNRLTRLNSDGSEDTSFYIGSGVNDGVSSIAVQPNGKIIIGGAFTSYNGRERNRLTRLNSDGSLDTNFYIGSGANNAVRSVVIQSDGRIVIGGYFTSYNRTNRNRVARLNSDGGPDFSFDVGSGVEGSVDEVVVQSDGKVVIAGFFSSVDTYTRNNVARLEGRFKPAASLSLASSPKPSQYGQSVTFTATTVPLNTTGATQFTFGTGTNSVTVTSNLENGIATYVTSTLPIGDTPVQASYNGDANYTSSTSSVYIQTVTKIATNLSITSNPNPSPFGGTTTFTALVSPAQATGIVTFTIGAAQVSALVANGVATYVTNTLATGSYPLSATYGGSSVYSSSVSSGEYTLTVNPPVPGIIQWEVANYSVGEANASVILTATRTGGTDGPVSTTVVITDSTATSSDYSTPNSFVLSWADGEGGFKTFHLPIVNDTVYEGNESLILGLTNLLGGANPGSPITTTLTIIEDDLPPCNPQVVTSPTDDGQATTCGTLSFALTQITKGTITFALASGGNTINFTGSLTSMLKPGVKIDGGANGIVFNGNGVAENGLRLGGGNTLTNLTIKSFGGQELMVTVSSTANQLFHVKVQS